MRRLTPAAETPSELLPARGILVGLLVAIPFDVVLAGLVALLT